jgi:hypothetical protein
VSYPKDEMAPPPAVHDDERAFELARVWLANGAPHVALRTGVWPDPAAWGIVLVDLARHVALAYDQAGVLALEEAFERVLLGMRAELEGPAESED